MTRHEHMDRPQDNAEWDWSVPLDDAFVRAAPAREQSGAVRAATARRISDGHRGAQPWRAPLTLARTAPRGSAGRRRIDWRTLAISATVLVAIAVATVVIGPHRLAGQFAAGVAPVGDGTPRIPRPADARDVPLSAPAPAPAGAGGFTFLAEHDGRPISFDPCRPLHYVLREQGAPAGAAALLAQAFTQLTTATGLVFVFDGVTDESHDADRSLVQERYGDRYAPILVVWSDERETPGLAGRIAGFAGPRTADPDGAGPRYVSGTVVLDGPQLGERPESAGHFGVVLHELGHLVGLGHVPDPSDIMFRSSGPLSGYTAGALRGLARLGSGPCFDA